MRYDGLVAAGFLMLAASAAAADPGWQRTEIVEAEARVGCMWQTAVSDKASLSVYFDRHSFALIFRSPELPATGTYIQTSGLSFGQVPQTPDRIEPWADGLYAAVWAAERAPFREFLEAPTMSFVLASALNDYGMQVELSDIRSVLAGMETCRIDSGAGVDLVAGRRAAVIAAVTGKTVPTTVGGTSDNSIRSAGTDPTATVPTRLPGSASAGVVVTTPVRTTSAAPTGIELVMAVQAELARVGCYTSGVDGKWGSGSRRALEAFVRHSGTDRDASALDADLLEAIKAETERVCPLIRSVGKSRDTRKRTARTRTRSRAPSSTSSRSSGGSSGGGKTVYRVATDREMPYDRSAGDSGGSKSKWTSRRTNRPTRRIRKRSRGGGRKCDYSLSSTRCYFDPG